MLDNLVGNLDRDGANDSRAFARVREDCICQITGRGFPVCSGDPNDLQLA